MKIAMMTNNYKPFIAGVPISVERLAEGLKEEGHEVTVFAPAYKAQMKEEGVVRFHSFLEGIAGGVVIPNPLDPVIERRFREEDYDIIHVHHPIAIGNTAAYLSHKYKVPMVFTYHTRYEEYLHYVKPMMWVKNLVPAYLKSFFEKCEHIFAPTEGMEDYLTGICGVEGEKVSVLPTGLKEESYHGELQNTERIQKMYDAQNCPLFVSVSRLAHEKNISFLLYALSRFKRSFRKPFKMLLIGDGPERGSYEKLVCSLGLEEEVIFTGTVANAALPDYYRAADLFLFASKTETQGIVILEAMAGETPVIALKATGVSDLVKNGQNGYCVEEDMDLFAERMAEVLNNRKLHTALAGEAFKTAYAFREKEIAKKAAEIYKAVVKRNHEKERNFFQMATTGINLLSEL